jgi:hypothetical protein
MKSNPQNTKHLYRKALHTSWKFASVTHFLSLFSRQLKHTLPTTQFEILVCLPLKKGIRNGRFGNNVFMFRVAVDASIRRNTDAPKNIHAKASEEVQHA